MIRIGITSPGGAVRHLVNGVVLHPPCHLGDVKMDGEVLKGTVTELINLVETEVTIQGGQGGRSVVLLTVLQDMRKNGYVHLTCSIRAFPDTQVLTDQAHPLLSVDVAFRHILIQDEPLRSRKDRIAHCLGPPPPQCVDDTGILQCHLAEGRPGGHVSLNINHQEITNDHEALFDTVETGLCLVRPVEMEDDIHPPDIHHHTESYLRGQIHFATPR